MILRAFLPSCFKKIIPIILFLISINAFGQHSISLKISTANKEPLAGANVLLPSINKNFTSDSTGKVLISNLGAGNYKLVISYAGMQGKTISISLPSMETQIEIVLEEGEEEEEVIIQSTRSTRTITDIPTRVEFVAGEELDEKANMKPGDIRMVLNESTGIQTQQTSATSANASIRIQGLDGRYTQVLKDGFPLFAGFSGGLGLLQTPPLDLKQFEVIKGSASTLYGGGAISGLVNLISKTPGEEKELKFHLDLTGAGGINSSGFYSRRFEKIGLTLFATRNSNSAYDPAGIGFSAIPKFERYTVNPKLFFYFSPQTELYAGVNFTTEDRTGGDMSHIKGNNPAGFFEKNNTDRFSTQLSFTHRLNDHAFLKLKNSWNHFKRKIALQGYDFNGTQNGSFTELTYTIDAGRSEWITGLNILSDQFKEVQLTSIPLRNYNEFTTGAFIQHNARITDKLHIETGLRGDLVKDYGFAFLPRLSLLFKFTPEISSRIGGGLGYKTPNIFTEESERLHYRDVLPVDKNRNELERSIGFNGDINYKTSFADGELSFSINQLFFYTRINDPLLLQPEGNNFRFNNIAGHLDSKGMETNARFGYHDFKLFLGYTFVNAYLHEGSVKTKSYLTPEHRLNTVLLYEVEEKLKIGLEAYYYGKQDLSDGSTGKSYWITGLMAEKLWEKISLYINFENFTDTRQTKFGTIYTGPVNAPVFRDIYAPLDGFVINGGVKLRL